jgi:hypothetical protein
MIAWMASKLVLAKCRCFHVFEKYVLSADVAMTLLAAGQTLSDFESLAA